MIHTFKDTAILRGNTEKCPAWTMPKLSASTAQESIPAARIHTEEPDTQEFDSGFESGHTEGLAAGHAEGYEAGLKQGLADARAETQALTEKAIAEAISPITSLVKEFDAALTHTNDLLNDSIVALALQTGKALARSHLDLHPELITDIVRDLLHSEPMLQNKPRLWLHSTDLAIVKESLGSEIDSLGWRLVADDSLTPGGCKVTSGDGEMDATWETRWNLVASKYLPANAS